MIQKDYIERMMQQIAEVIAELLRLKIDDGLELVQEAYQEWLKIDSNVVDEIPLENLLDVLVEEKGMSVNQLEILATLLYKEGEFWFNDNQWGKCKVKLEKSLTIYHFVDKEQAIFSLDREATLKSIESLIERCRD